MTEKEEIYYSDYYQKYFGDLLFPNGQTKIPAEEFIQILSQKENSWIFDPKLIRDKIKPSVDSYLITPMSSKQSEVGTIASKSDKMEKLHFDFSSN